MALRDSFRRRRGNVRGARGADARFREVLWPQMPAVLRLAQVLCGGNVAEAEDLAQETMLKAFRSIDSFKDGTDARAWLATILRNTRIDRLRTRAGQERPVSLDEFEMELADPSEEAAEWYQVGDSPDEILQEFSDAQVIEALHKIPEEIRWTLLLVDVEGMDHAEAAKVLDVPVGTVKSRAFRGRQMLREALLPVAKELRITGRRS